jgi:hypothetical protein
MRKGILYLLTASLSIALLSIQTAHAQTTPLQEWKPCRLTLPALITRLMVIGPYSLTLLASIIQPMVVKLYTPTPRALTTPPPVTGLYETVADWELEIPDMVVVF